MIAIFLEALEEVKLLREDLAEHREFVDTDKVCADKMDGLITLPLIVPSLFLVEYISPHHSQRELEKRTSSCTIASYASISEGTLYP